MSESAPAGIPADDLARDTPTDGLTEPTNGAPRWAFLEMPKPKTDGEAIPPIPVTFAVGLTEPDAAGHQWAILQLDDGTTSTRVRIPWQFAGPVGMTIAQGLAAMAAQAEQRANSGLILPPGANSPLIVAPSGAVPRG